MVLIKGGGLMKQSADRRAITNPRSLGKTLSEQKDANRIRIYELLAHESNRYD